MEAQKPSHGVPGQRQSEGCVLLTEPLDVCRCVDKVCAHLRSLRDWAALHARSHWACHHGLFAVSFLTGDWQYARWPQVAWCVHGLGCVGSQNKKRCTDLHKVEQDEWSYADRARQRRSGHVDAKHGVSPRRQNAGPCFSALDWYECESMWDLPRNDRQRLSNEGLGHQEHLQVSIRLFYSSSCHSDRLFWYWVPWCRSW